jgi:site-specific DNA recombinase
MITLDEFDRVQRILGRPGRARAQTKRHFAYTGMIRCACGLSVTAEEKAKPSGRRYVYYHCTKRRGTTLCREPYVSLSDLEKDIEGFLGSIGVGAASAEALRHSFAEHPPEARPDAEAESGSLDAGIEALESELEKLIKLRIRHFVSEESFLRQHAELETSSWGKRFPPIATLWRRHWDQLRRQRPS